MLNEVQRGDIFSALFAVGLKGGREGLERRKYRIIGTAGHIDHGKTCLVKALTGTDTDRLAEEKKRGITIENGFAFLELPDGTRAGIVDVPGHEKFIKNMLAGAGGVDIAMLVIAADEGVMPQTREHLEILSLLGISHGVVVITKSDLEWKSGLMEEIRELVRGTFLENENIVVTSAAAGAGIEELRAVLWKLCASESTGGKNGRFRLPIDRVFSIKGFGTVATGTLLDGVLELGSEPLLYPQEKNVKIRSIQVHGQETGRAFPGQRVAVNLPGIGKDEISRGQILAEAGSMESTMMVNVRLQLLESAHRALRSGARVHFYHGAAQLVCKVILLDREVLKPGEVAVVQLRLEQVSAMKAGDHFIIRFYSPVETIGGGVVLEPNAVKQGRKQRSRGDKGGLQKQRSRKNADGALEQQNRENGSGLQVPSNQIFFCLQELYQKAGFNPPLTDDVKSSFSRDKDFSGTFFAMVRSGVLVRFDEKRYIHCEIRQKAVDMVYLLYKETKVIRTGEFRDRLGISRKCAITLLEGFDKAGITVMEDGERTVTNIL